MSDQPAEYDRDLILAMERAGYAVRTRTEYEYLLDTAAQAEAERDDADKILTDLTDHIRNVTGGKGIDGLVAERNRLRAVIAEYQRTLNRLDADLEDDDVDGVGPQYRDWKAAQRALLDTPTTDNPEGT